jgi:beta-galactosidase
MASVKSGHVAQSRVVSYDGSSFLVRGKRVFLLSGSVHYPRVHPSRWTELFATFREASLNTVETYVFWGEHLHFSPRDSETDPLENIQYDFEGRRDLFRFLQAAHDAGLHAILRIGPYVCAEVSYGGFPFALRDVPGMRFRTLNAPFQKEVARWVRYVAAELHARKLMAPEGGPVVLIQFENEYQMVAGAYGDEGTKYLQWCSDLQHQLNLDVPTIMCYGAAEGAVETINSFYAHEQVPDIRKAHPEQPPVWTECWTGWYDVWGAPHHRRPTEDLCGAVARFCAVGGAGLNYYMWLGGTNFGRTPMYLQATSYDYDAPIDEYYMPTTKSRRLQALHRVLMDYYVPQLFCWAERKDGKSSGCPSPIALASDVVLYAWAPELAFVCNDSLSSTAVDIVVPESNLRIPSMSPRSVQIVNPSDGLVLFDSGSIPTEHNVSRVFKKIQCISGDSHWVERIEPILLGRPDAPSGIYACRAMNVSQDPPEQLKLTKDCSDYCFYSASYEWNREILSDEMLRSALSDVSFSFEACDFVYIFVNGIAVARSAEPLWEDRKNNQWNENSDPPGFRHSVSGSLQHVVEGVQALQGFTLTILVCSLGLVKGDWQLGQGQSANMLEEKKGLLSDVSVSVSTVDESASRTVASRVSPWTAVAGLEGESQGWPSEGALGGASRELGSMSASSVPTWYEATLVVQKRSGSWVLDLGRMGKGVLWVNGHLLGRYWSIPGTRPRNGFLKDAPIVQDACGPPTQRYYHIPPWVVPSDDDLSLRITLFEERGINPKAAKVCLLEVT